MKIKDLVSPIENNAHRSLQEEYDNSGLIVGCYGNDVNKALVALDCTEEVVDEAINKGCDIIFTHHPILFSGLKKINGRNYIERVIIKAIQNKISIYAAHTNLDNYGKGVNHYFSEKLGLKNCTILAPKQNILNKLVVFCPLSHAEQVRSAIFQAGAGTIGDYDYCSFNSSGKGSFKAQEGTDPFVGEIGKIHYEEEIRIETIFPTFLKSNIIHKMIEAHPYEEVAYDIYPLNNEHSRVGAGMIGELENEMGIIDFFNEVKEVFQTGCIRHTQFIKDKVKKIAFCGGSGSFLIDKAKKAGADVYLTGDIKYHQFFDAEEKIVIADIGHFESEQFTMELIYDAIKENFPKFAISISEVKTNPVNYFV